MTLYLPASRLSVVRFADAKPRSFLLPMTPGDARILIAIPGGADKTVNVPFDGDQAFAAFANQGPGTDLRGLAMSQWSVELDTATITTKQPEPGDMVAGDTWLALCAYNSDGGGTLYAMIDAVGSSMPRMVARGWRIVTTDGGGDPVTLFERKAPSKG